MYQTTVRFRFFFRISKNSIHPKLFQPTSDHVIVLLRKIPSDESEKIYSMKGGMQVTLLQDKEVKE